MNKTRLRASLAACLAAGAIVATSWPETVVWGAEAEQARPAQMAVPRDPRPAQVTPLRPQVRLTGDRVQRLADADSRGLDYVPGEVVVRFRPLTTPAGRQRALNALRGRPALADVEWHGPVGVVRDPTQPNAHALAQQLMSQPEVAYAEPNFILRIDPVERGLALRADAAAEISPTAAPNDQFYASYQWNFSSLNMSGAWDIQPGGRSDIVVAVVDSGITGAPTSMTFRIWTGSAFENVSMPFSVNPDLAASRLVDASDFAFFDSGPVLDFDGHGTHVSSTIGEDTNNNLLLAGLAYNVRIMPVKVCIGYWEKMIVNGLTNTPGFASTSSSCVVSDIAAGIRYAADRGATVINLSLGGPLSAPPANLREALSYAVSQGAFSAISMGNNFEQGNETNYPAFFAQELMGVMSVAAIGKTQSKSYYSATGAYCEISAPGGDIRVGGTPDNGLIFQSTLDPDDSDPEDVRRPRFDRYVGLGQQGTSMASPHVAGLAALIAAQSPGITPADIERAIRATARDLGPPGKDNEYGYGLIQPRSVLFGWGLRK